MSLFIFIYAAIFILIGWMIKRYPDTLAGYNTLSKEKKARIDIEGLSTLWQKGLIGTGIGCILSYYLVMLSGAESWAWISTIFPLLIFPYIQWRSYKYMPASPRKRVYTLLFYLFLIAAIGGRALFLMKKPQVYIEEEQIEITGIHGTTISFKEISHLRQTNYLPALKMRVNGFAAGSVKKGIFKFATGENGLLFLESGKQPFIEIILTTGKQLFYNNSTPEKTLEIFDTMEKAFLSFKEEQQITR